MSLGAALMWFRAFIAALAVAVLSGAYILWAENSRLNDSLEGARAEVTDLRRSLTRNNEALETYRHAYDTAHRSLLVRDRQIMELEELVSTLPREGGDECLPPAAVDRLRQLW